MMEYGPEHASDALNSIARGTASFETRAQLEQHLLSVLRRRGIDGVSAFLKSLPGYDFTTEGAVSGDEEGRFAALGPDARRLIVTTFRRPHLASVNVEVEDESASTQPDPRHRAFYDIWEGMVGLGVSHVRSLDPPRQAVFYVALLEAEVMNGGLGQYLTNTDGAYVDATLRCLAEIGASRTAAILAEAARVGEAAESYAAAWEANPEIFERLDEAFLASDEDLAGLTADKFLDPVEDDGSV